MRSQNHYLNKIYLLIVISSLLFSCKSTQIQKRDLIELDEIVFERYSRTYDSLEYQKSREKTNSAPIEETIEAAISELREENKHEDSTVMDSIMSLALELKNQILYKPKVIEKQTFSFKFQDSLIVYYDSGIKNGYLVINQNKSNFYTLSKADSSTRFSGDINYQYDSEFGISIKEYKDDRKNIFGIDCFKVTVGIRNDIDDNVYEIQDYLAEYEMYVSDKIQYKFHPIIKFESILDKYYPLEIIKRLSFIKGIEYTYTLHTLKTK